MRVACFFARAHGLNGLQSLLACERYDPCLVLTHRLRPRSEDRARAERPEYRDFSGLCDAAGVPVDAVDREADLDRADRALREAEPELLASISWRRLIPPEQLRLARIGGVNLHRGALPAYPGPRPIHQALQAGDDTIEITAHELAETYDSGEVLAVERHSAQVDESESLEAAEERIKAEITPLFGPLLLRALDTLVARKTSP